MRCHLVGSLAVACWLARAAWIVLSGLVLRASASYLSAPESDRVSRTLANLLLQQDRQHLASCHAMLVQLSVSRV